MRSETPEQSASAQHLLLLFGPWDECYAFAVDYREQTVAIIKQKLENTMN
jgi:hypothetical protein